MSASIMSRVNILNRMLYGSTPFVYKGLNLSPIPSIIPGKRFVSELLKTQNITEQALLNTLTGVYTDFLKCAMLKQDRYPMLERRMESVIKRMQSECKLPIAINLNEPIESSFINFDIIKGVDIDRYKNELDVYYQYVGDFEQEGLKYFLHTMYTKPYIFNSSNNPYLKKKQVSELNMKLLLKAMVLLKTKRKIYYKENDVVLPYHRDCTNYHIISLENQLIPPRKFYLQSNLLCEWIAGHHLDSTQWKIVDIDYCLKGNYLFPEYTPIDEPIESKPTKEEGKQEKQQIQEMQEKEAKDAQYNDTTKVYRLPEEIIYENEVCRNKINECLSNYDEKLINENISMLATNSLYKPLSEKERAKEKPKPRQQDDKDSLIKFYQAFNNEASTMNKDQLNENVLSELKDAKSNNQNHVINDSSRQQLRELIEKYIDPEDYLPKVFKVEKYVDSIKLCRDSVLKQETEKIEDNKYINSFANKQESDPLMDMSYEEQSKYFDEYRAKPKVEPSYGEEYVNIDKPNKFSAKFKLGKNIPKKYMFKSYSPDDLVKLEKEKSLKGKEKKPTKMTEVEKEKAMRESLIHRREGTVVAKPQPAMPKKEAGA